MKHLTKRELEVCKYLTQGLDNSEIAARLFISRHTVKIYVSSIIEALGAKNRTEVAYILANVILCRCNIFAICKKNNIIL